MGAISERFEKIYPYIKSEAFLSMSALGGELPSYISSYDPKDEFEVSSEIERTIKRLKADGIGVVGINLFSLCVELLRQEELLDAVIEQEKELSKDELLDVLGGALDVIKYIVPAVVSKIKECANPQMLIIYGIGGAYPFLRSHTLLNNLQTAVKEIPTLMFFPGLYSGGKLRLLGLREGDNHYRAFDLNILLEDKR